MLDVSWDCWFHCSCAEIQITGSVGETYNLPILINPQDFMVFTLIAVVLSIAAGTYPAYRASKLDPVIAIRE